MKLWQTDIWHWTLYRIDWINQLDSNCLAGSDRVEVSRQCVTEEDCLEHGWSLTGDACNDSNITHAVADVFLLSVILFLGTFTVAMTFRMFRTSRFFPTIVCTTHFISLLWYNSVPWRIHSHSYTYIYYFCSFLHSCNTATSWTEQVYFGVAIIQWNNINFIYSWWMTNY